jgi:TRAP-type transport system small permease protein
MHVTSINGGDLDRFRQRYGLFLERVVMVLMVLLAAEVTLGIVYRTVGQSLVWYDEVASVLLAWLTFYGSALASVKRGHIGCPEVVDQLPAQARRWVGIFSQVLVILFFALLGWVGLIILPVLATDALESLPWVPMSFVQSVIPISSVLILLAETLNLIDLLRDKGVAVDPLADSLH